MLFMQNAKNDTKKIFLKKGACSHTFFHILNREFGNNKPIEERATDPLAGGILQMGHQCGMLWGASMAVGAEAHRRTENIDDALSLAIRATQNLMKSFHNRTKSHHCSDITDTDFSNKMQMLRYMLFRAHSCFSLAKHWTADAIKAAKEGLTTNSTPLPNKCTCCTSELVKKMNGTEEQMATVAGLAGGMGLSGNACAALSTAIWMKAMKWCKKNPDKSLYKYPEGQQILDTFHKITGNMIECKEITGKEFTSIEDHTEFIDNGGCKNIIEELSKI